MHSPLPRRAAITAAAALTLALASPLAASAHVSVTPAEADPGAYAQLTFRVPNERDDSGTVRVEVTLPTDTPFASVSYQPVPGWSTTLVTASLPEPVEVAGNELTEAVTGVVWEAESGTEIAPGQYQTFPVSVGPVPEVGSVALPATQTYSDGEVVEWTGAPDSELPAPILYIEDEAEGRSHEADETEDTATVSSTESRSDDGLARGLGITGVVLGAMGVVLGAFAFTRSRRPAP